MMKPEVYADFEKLSLIQQRYTGIETELKALFAKWDELMSTSA